MTTAAASLAALAGLAAWVDGKYHVRQDVAALRFKKGAERYYDELGTSCFSFSPSTIPLYQH
jgi:hypothetical protein